MGMRGGNPLKKRKQIVPTRPIGRLRLGRSVPIVPKKKKKEKR